MKFLPLLLLLSFSALADIQSDCEAESEVLLSQGIESYQSVKWPDADLEIRFLEQLLAGHRARVEFCVLSRTLTREEFRAFLLEAFPNG